jgi:L-amino acid N-acyltransferase YncA
MARVELPSSDAFGPGRVSDSRPDVDALQDAGPLTATHGAAWGASSRIRPLGPEDRAAEGRFIENLSLYTRRFLVLGTVDEPGEAPVARLAFAARTHEQAFVALAPGAAGELAGIARYASDASRRRCECQVTLADECEDEALAAALMARLVHHARAQGMRVLFAEIGEDAQRVQALARELGFHRCRARDTDRVVHCLALRAGSPQAA